MISIIYCNCIQTPNYGYYTDEIQHGFKAINLITFPMGKAKLGCRRVHEVRRPALLLVSAGPGLILSPATALSSGSMWCFTKPRQTPWWLAALDPSPQAVPSGLPNHLPWQLQLGCFGSSCVVLTARRALGLRDAESRLHSSCLFGLFAPRRRGLSEIIQILQQQPHGHHLLTSLSSALALLFF